MNLTIKVNPYPGNNDLVREGEPFAGFCKDILCMSADKAVVTHGEVKQQVHHSYMRS